MDATNRAYLVRRWKDELRAAERANSDIASDRHHRLASGYARRIAAIDAAHIRRDESRSGAH